MLASEIRELNDRELEDRIAELQEERFRLRLRAATQSLEQPHRLRDLRRDIARMRTVLTERKKGIGPKTTAAPETKRAATTKRTAKKRTATKRASARGGRS
jgi:large subunit ribosomal protein L29